jgi:3'-5' exoribonuclease
MQQDLTVDNAMEYLSDIASTLPKEHQAMVNIIFTDPAFAVAPGGSSHHHNYMGGLALHTAEVVRNCLKLAGVTIVHHSIADPSDRSPRATPFYTGELNIKALLVAAFVHDYLKTLEYGYELETVAHPDVLPVVDEVAPPMIQRIKDGKISKLPYLYTIGHVTGGAMLFHMNAMNAGLPFDFTMAVTHILLAHHGQRDWGSPVTPKTAEAWLLHSADMLSAQPL